MQILPWCNTLANHMSSLCFYTHWSVCRFYCKHLFYCMRLVYCTRGVSFLLDTCHALMCLSYYHPLVCLFYGHPLVCHFYCHAMR